MKGSDIVGWDSEARKLVFELFNQGQPEASIVKQVVGRHQCNDKTVRRCIAGLGLAQLQPEGHQPGHLARERFENLGGELTIMRASCYGPTRLSRA